MIALTTIIAIVVLFIVFRIISPALDGYVDIIPDDFAKQGDSGNYRLAAPDVCSDLGVMTDCVRAASCTWCQHTGMCMRKSGSCPTSVDMGPNIINEPFADLSPINNELLGDAALNDDGEMNASANTIYY